MVKKIKGRSQRMLKEKPVDIKDDDFETQDEPGTASGPCEELKEGDVKETATIEEFLELPYYAQYRQVEENWAALPRAARDALRAVGIEQADGFRRLANFVDPSDPDDLWSAAKSVMGELADPPSPVVESVAFFL